MSQIKIEDRGNYVVMKLSGSFTGGLKETEDVIELRNAFKELAAQDKVMVVIDFGETDYLASNALGALLSGNAILKKKNGRAALFNASDYLKNIFDIVKFKFSFPIVDTEEDAVKAINEPFKY